MRTNEKGEYNEEKPCSEATAVTHGPRKVNGEQGDHPFRKLSISNFEPIQPNGNVAKTKKAGSKDIIPNFSTPQPVRTDNMLRNEAFMTCFNKLVFK